MALVTRIMPMSRDNDPRRVILDDVEPILRRTEMRMFGADVLIGTYDRAGQKTAGGLIVPENYGEDRIQGKTGLILLMGPHCSVENEDFVNWFSGKPPKIGDWIGYSIRDSGITMLVGKTTCQTREFKYLRFYVSEPDLVM